MDLLELWLVEGDFWAKWACWQAEPHVPGGFSLELRQGAGNPLIFGYVLKGQTETQEKYRCLC